jgi:predicted DNA-binding transcriptional regulator AlpA
MEQKTIERVTLRPDDLAQMLGTSRSTVYAGLRNGKIPRLSFSKYQYI